ncbi:MAG: GIY-YIG nuclease family protein [Ignavibacteriales bacterium]|nr:GIY-YIG nuclease family protein [Ignavibacteriales bacterium]
MYFVYVLQSITSKKYYIGQTDNLERRFQQHNSGYSKSTKSGVPWELVYHKEFESRSEAYQFEQKIKRMKSAKFIEELISVACQSRM